MIEIDSARFLLEETLSVEATFNSLLESGNVILLEDNQQVVEITAEQAQQLGIHKKKLAKL